MYNVCRKNEKNYIRNNPESTIKKKKENITVVYAVMHCQNSSLETCIYNPN